METDNRAAKRAIFDMKLIKASRHLTDVIYSLNTMEAKKLLAQLPRKYIDAIELTEGELKLAKSWEVNYKK